MPAYAYPIKINRQPLKVKYARSEDVGDGILTISKVLELVKEHEVFSIHENENSLYRSYTMHINGERDETAEEVAVRVEKEEKYMEEYNKRQAAKKL